MSDFATTLRDLRTLRRLSQSRLARWAGVDHSYVSRLESRDRAPTREMVETLAGAMDLTGAERSALLMAGGFLPWAPGQSPALGDVIAERERQHRLWGRQELSWPEWLLILSEEVGEASQAAGELHFRLGSTAALREELVQVAAVAVQVIEAIDAGAEIEEEAA